jgi:uncharacterized membrane protein YhaH (DUF805 family)
MIGFGEAIRSGLEQYLSARGRASRAEYWWWWLLLSALQLLVGDGALSTLVLLALFLPSVTVLVRRLHDTGRSAWSLLVALIPIVGFLLLLYFLVQRGDPMPNQYGPPRVATARTGDGWGGWQDGGGWQRGSGWQGPSGGHDSGYGELPPPPTPGPPR